MMQPTLREADRRITADDHTIEAALREAHVPSLMTALVHLTGDLGILRGDIRPQMSMFGDPQGGIPEQQQATVRATALKILKDYRDGGCRLPPPPSQQAVREMLHFMVGTEISEDYVNFLMTELALEGEDPYAQPAIEEIPADVKARFRVVVIGAGMSGVLAGIRLAEAGIPFTIIEKNPEVGGTWFENTYPGCRVDSPNHNYSYSFAPNDWPQHFSEQKALLDYFVRCATEYGIRDHIQFNTEVEAATYDDAGGHWALRLRRANGGIETFDANAVISAVGQLNRPRFPDIPGRDAFQGISFHSARWQHEHDLRGKRVAVIGTGASAFQFVPVIAKEAAEVTIFQRTPPWVIPNPSYFEEVPPGKHWLLNHVPFYATWFRFSMFWRTAEGIFTSAKRDPDWPESGRSISQGNDELRQLLTRYIEATVGDDPDLLAQTIPDYPPAGKRMLIDDGTWLRTLKRDHVHLVSDPIQEIGATGLTTQSDTRYEFDAIIYGTGFQASRFLAPMKITGSQGADLQEHWDGDPRAYLGITIPGFPNLFCLYGPNTNIVVNGSIIFFSECEVRYILGCLALLMREGHAAMDCRREVHEAYNERIDAANLEMAWGVPNVRSWYKNSKGRVTQNWPFTLLQFWSQTKTPDPADYLFS